MKDADEVPSHQFLRFLKTNVSEFIDNPSPNHKNNNLKAKKYNESHYLFTGVCRK